MQSVRIVLMHNVSRSAALVIQGSSYVIRNFQDGWTVVSLVANMALVFLVFSLAQTITRKLGKAGMRAVAKVFSLFMAGIAIMMIRSGIEGMIRSHA